MSHIVRRILLTALCVVPLAESSTALAHSGFIPAEILEGNSTSGNYRLVHACDESQLPVIATSLVVPTVNPFLERNDGGPISDLSEVLQTSGLEDLIIPYYDRGLFTLHELERDDLGNTLGFHSRGGKLPLGFYGQTAVQINTVFFNSDACAAELRVKIAAADICRITGVVRPGDANLWIPNRTPRFANGNVHGSSRQLRKGSPLTLRFKRDLASNPLPASCKGKSFTVTVWPSNEDIDAHLPIPGFWPKP